MEGSVFAEVEAQSARLGLPAGFYSRLLNEDDWSFVIKLNALVEAACSDALAARLNTPELAASLASLDLGHKKHGKVALLRSLGAITREQASVLQMLYQLRNMLAHNISHVAFSFTSHVAGLDKQQLKIFIQRAGHGIQEGPSGVSVPEFVTAQPKLAVWITVAETLACLHLEHDLAKVRSFQQALEKLGGGEHDWLCP